MKNKGTKFSASSLLTILGVICFASVIVTAVLVTSNSLSFTGTGVTNPSIVLTATTTPGATLTGNTATYVFNANVGNALTSGAKVDIVIAKTGINITDISTPLFSYDGGSATALVFTDAGDTLTATFTVGTQAIDATIPCTMTIIYAVTGTFTVTATMSGNA
jgi:hypothetical protein